jgi:hypothetical protein
MHNFVPAAGKSLHCGFKPLSKRSENVDTLLASAIELQSSPSCTVYDPVQVGAATPEVVVGVDTEVEVPLMPICVGLV